MALERPRQGKLSQFVANHVLGDKNLVKYFAIVHKERKPNKLRDYGTTSCPCLDRGPVAAVGLSTDLDIQLLIDKRAFFLRSSH